MQEHERSHARGRWEPPKPGSAAARALAEAKARREAAAQEPRPVEIGGPAGPDPVRYGDWERKGIASDF